MLLVSLLIALLAVTAILLYRWRRARRWGSDALTDDMIRQIEASGSLEVDEPLDRDRIREAEERFWNETWDEPEEW
ncbi:MAG TPA: hypothetical protein VF188_10575 [Longimicrobiales bacterium]